MMLIEVSSLMSMVWMVALTVHLRPALKAVRARQGR